MLKLIVPEVIKFTMTQSAFGEFKEDALRLLKVVINLLNNNNVDHFLISGTLLGYVRSKDFIPWDDDIDIACDDSILHKLSEICKTDNLNIFHKSDCKYDSIKFCFSDSLEITDESAEIWKQNCITKDNKYCWPFIDVFIYESGPGVHSCGGEKSKTIVLDNEVEIYNWFSGPCGQPFRIFSKHEISFFHNDWPKSEFFPLVKTNLLGVECNIPRNPDFFLRTSYGVDYLTNFVVYPHTHRPKS